MSRLVEAHIDAQHRLRRSATDALTSAWMALPSYDESDVPAWLSTAVPISRATQRASIALTNAYLARYLRRQPAGVNPSSIMGAIRNGSTPDEVYRRPFVTVWTALKNGAGYDQAIAAGLARATSTGAMDVQLAMRGTMQSVQDTDPGIFGFQRVADGGACEFCQAIDGAYVKSAAAMPLHNHCGCGLEPLTRPHPRAAALPSGVAVHEHGELGPVLTAPGDHFTRL